MTCDPNTLSENARVIDKTILPGMRWPVLIFLFCEIANGSSCVNIFPPESAYVYGFGDPFFFFTIDPTKTYLLIAGPNEAGWNTTLSPANTPFSNGDQVVIPLGNETVGLIPVAGTGLLVTAILCET